MSEFSPRKERLANIPTAVYRFYDAAGELLYLGMTHDVDGRWATHERTQPWWLDVARREFTWCGTRAEAEQIESTATALEKPRYDRSGQRTIGGEVDQRLDAETARAMQVVSEDIDNGTYPLWSVLPSYGVLSARYGIPIIGITRGMAKLANLDHHLVYHRDQFAVSLPGRRPSMDAKRVGLLFFLASNAFGESTFTRADLAEVTGVSEGTAHQHLKRWQQKDRAERLPKVAGARSYIYRIIRHPEPDPPGFLFSWGEKDLRALAQWLLNEITEDPQADDRDLAIVQACLPVEYEVGASNVGVRVLKVVAQKYANRPGCLPEWGIA